MRCDDVQEKIVDGQPEALIREHLAACAECRAFARDWQQLQAGLRSLSGETAPEPSWGFAARVLRRIDAVDKDVREVTDLAPGAVRDNRHR